MEAIRTILVPTDLSEISAAAARTAAKLAEPDAASVHLLHVIRLPFLHTTYDVNVPEAVWEGLRKGMHRRLAETTRELEKMGVREVHSIVSESLQPDEATVKTAESIDADLIVMATRGRRGLPHALLGSITERTIRTSPVPVLAVKDDGLTTVPIARILLATDFSAHAKHAQELACAFAKRTGARLEVLHVLDESPDYIRSISAEIAAFEDQARTMAVSHLERIDREIRDAGVTVETHIRKGHPVDGIVAEAERMAADLIVIGTHGHRGFARLALGSVAERTLRLAPCAVLTTHAGDE